MPAAQPLGAADHGQSTAASVSPPTQALARTRCARLNRKRVFRGERRAMVDRSRWKEIRRKDAIRVYTDRKSSVLKMARIKGHLGERRDRTAAAETPSLPPFPVVGTVVGDLDDVMLGTISPTVDDMKTKKAYVEDGLVESKVLQQLIHPTPDDPFRTLCVKWVVVHPPKVQSLIRARDYTYIDSTGIVISPSGEHIGFRITHSIAFPNFPNFEQEYTVVRGNTSVCCLYRQSAPNIVDCFVTGFFELHGDVLKGLALLAIAGQGLSFSKQVHCAQMKKLAWRLRLQQKMSHTMHHSSVLGDDSGSLTDCCKVCSRTFVSSRTSRFLLGPITKKCCSLCFELVCSKCRVKKRLYFIDHGHKLIYQDLSFCSPYVTETVRMDAYEIAKDVFGKRGSHYNPHSASHTTRSRSSQSSSSSSRHHPMLATTLSSSRSDTADLQVWDE